MYKISLTVILLLFLAACSLKVSPETGTAVPNLPDTLLPSLEPTHTVASATETPLPEPTITTLRGPASLLPDGFITAVDPTGIGFHALDGSLVGGIASGELAYTMPYAFHVTGPALESLPPVIYLGWRDGLQMIQNTGGEESVLFTRRDLYRVKGAEGLPYLAFSTADLTGTGLVTSLSFGTPETLAEAAPILEISGGEGGAIKPLAIHMEAGLPAGIWFTDCWFGIGGDIIFDPCNGLTYLDLSTGLVSDRLENDFNPSQLSPDQAWVAYSDHGGGSPLSILNLETGESHTFPVWLENDRGSGDGVFSPLNTHVAWMEGSGFNMEDPPTFHSLLRVGTTDGLLFGEYPAEFFTEAAGFPAVWLTPAAWLDEDSLLVQVEGRDETAALVRLDLPNTPTLLAMGRFLGLTYP